MISFRLQLYPPIPQLNHFTFHDSHFLYPWCQETPSIPRILPEAPAEPAGSGGCQRADMVITFIPIYIIYRICKQNKL